MMRRMFRMIEGLLESEFSQFCEMCPRGDPQSQRIVKSYSRLKKPLRFMICPSTSEPDPALEGQKGKVQNSPFPKSGRLIEIEREGSFRKHVLSHFCSKMEIVTISVEIHLYDTLYDCDAG
jgi:hypothetical protein